jgi:anti-sigma factor RsiW
MPCAEADRRLHAYFDGEMDALAAADFERHLEGCSDCRSALAELDAMRAALKRGLPYARTPSDLVERVSAALDRESATDSPRDARANGRPRVHEAGRPGNNGEKAPHMRDAGLAGMYGEPPPRAKRLRSFWWGALGGAGMAAAAAVLAFFALAPGPDVLLGDLVNAHVRSLMPGHLIDVESTDRHTVKPWFAGHADVSPVVLDFADQGYRLVGGRADFFDGQRAAAVVYQHGAHVINVFAWADERRSLPRNTTRNGYHLVFWRSGNLEYCAISDTGWDELTRLASLLENAEAAPPGEASGSEGRPLP